jgi:hypothetical protein
MFIAHACTKTSMSTNEDVNAYENNNPAKIGDLTAVNPFNKNVGAPVDGQTGSRWITYFKTKHGYNKTYTLNNNYIQTIISQSNCVGICLYYGLDGNNQAHVLPIGINNYGKRMQCDSISTMSGNISWIKAQQWIAKDPGIIDAHFLGSNTFYRLNKTPCKTIRVDYALNDKNEQQLLLSNPCVLNAIKQYEDNSVQCPPFCPNP